MRQLPDKPLNPPDEPPTYGKVFIENHQYGYCTASCPICLDEQRIAHEMGECNEGCPFCPSED